MTTYLGSLAECFQGPGMRKINVNWKAETQQHQSLLNLRAELHMNTTIFSSTLQILGWLRNLELKSKSLTTAEL